ncbi:phospholipase D SdSicTox-betaIIB1bxii-like [Centruroides sculpturatus]|uniref:phospholipase D SdSicTox-betaIIB1bxii-like n=2 Tax=Centruroides sculpturatus TaxID=218467 RepID=UPI000C6DB787|nr:phospholipase D SdSicTox-betaIIB1bxii-like [Centruroides sculpturatus]
MLRFICLCLLSSIQLSTQNVRPFWNIAHMVNSIDEIEEYLDEGANAIEADVTFDSDGTAKFMYHGFPCDCWRYCWRSSLLFRYLLKVKKLTTPDDPSYKENFTLLQLDCKISSLNSDWLRIKAGKDLAKKMVIFLWERGHSKSQVWILLSIPHSNHVNFIRSFRETLQEEGLSDLETKIGYDISGNEDPLKIENALLSVGVNSSIWFSDGITNCIPRSISRLRFIIDKRNSLSNLVNKVYFWTIDRENNLRKALRMGVDGIITNKPRRLHNILNSEEFKHTYRLSSITDNPWTKIIGPSKYYVRSDDYYFVECNKIFHTYKYYGLIEKR